MGIAYEHSSTQRDPLRSAPRTLRDAQLDPFDWIERPEAAANDVLVIVGPRPAASTRAGRRLSVLIALIVLCLALAVVRALFS
jgi:hypothetical protein